MEASTRIACNDKIINHHLSLDDNYKSPSIVSTRNIRSIFSTVNPATIIVPSPQTFCRWYISLSPATSQGTLASAKSRARNLNLPVYFSRNNVRLYHSWNRTNRSSFVSRSSDFTSPRKRVRSNSRASRVHSVGAVEETKKREEKREDKKGTDERKGQRQRERERWEIENKEGKEGRKRSARSKRSVNRRWFRFDSPWVARAVGRAWRGKAARASVLMMIYFGRWHSNSRLVLCQSTGSNRI